VDEIATAGPGSQRVTDAVWITRTYPWRDQPNFGVFYQTQARALARLGVAMTVACPTPWAPWPLSRLRPRWRDYAATPRRATDEGVSVIRPRYLNAPGEPTWARPDRMIADAMWRSRSDWAGARLIHGHYSVTGLAAWHLAERAGLPFVLTFHGSDMNTWPEEYPERVADLRTAVGRAGAVFAVSQALADRVHEVTGVTPVHLPLGSDHRSLLARKLPRAEARSQLGLPPDAVVVLFVGNLKPTKGVRELAEAILDIGRPFFGVVVGSGSEEGYGADDARAPGLLEYRGPQSHDDVIRYMSAADVLVLPSHTEGLPSVLVEAGSLGLPVIASAVGGIPELLGADRGSLLPDVSPASIAAALTHFADHRADADAAAGRLREFVLRDYDVDTNAARLLEWYRSIAPGFPAVGGEATS
jgi:teichuronic acid biosynthesis glycosyltransferase TuaC